MKKVALTIGLMIFVLFRAPFAHATCVEDSNHLGCSNPGQNKTYTCSVFGTTYCCDPGDGATACTTTITANAQQKLTDSSKKVCATSTASGACESCMQNKGAWTAVGCISTDPTAFVGKILQIAIGLGGGIAFLLIILGGFQMMTSNGNPEQLNAGKELVGSAIAGLLMIIFSIFILRLVGVTVLGIPGFT